MAHERRSRERRRGKFRAALRTVRPDPRPPPTSKVFLLLARPLLPMSLMSVLVAAAVIFGPPVLNELQLSGEDVASTRSRSAVASAFLQQNPQLANYRPLLIVVRLSAPPRSPQTRDRMDRVISLAAGSPGVGTVISYRGAGYVGEGKEGGNRRSPPLNDWQKQFFSRDQRWGLIVIPQEGLATGEPLRLADLEERVRQVQRVYIAGPPAISQELGDQVRKDLRQAELISFPAILLLLLLWFRRVPLAAIPLLAGAATLCETLLLIRIAPEWGAEFSLLAVAPVAGLALGLSVDYSMLLVSRYREECKVADNVNAALVAAIRAVAPVVSISATIMVFTLAPLTLFSIPLLSSLGTAVGYCAIVAAFNALTMAPLLLAIYGERITKPSLLSTWIPRLPQRRGRGFWVAAPRIATRYPKRVIGTVSLLLLLVAAPLALVQVSSLSDGAILKNSDAARMTQLVQRQFSESVGRERYTVLLIGPRMTIKKVKAAAKDLGRVEGVVQVNPPVRISTTGWKVEAEGASSIGSDPSRRTVGAIEDELRGLSPYISSPAAILVDRDTALRQTLLPVLGLSAAFILIILFGFTASFVLPVKFLILNLFTIFVSLGVVALFSQFSTEGRLDTVEVVILITVSLALITDYGVFVLGRIVEEHRAGAADEEAIVQGVSSTGPVVSAAAAVFAVALGAFVFSKIGLISQLSVGLIAAVVIDTTLVRALLVPAWMAWLGRFNWWAPKKAIALRRWLLT